MDKFTTAYLECALWSSIDEECEPLDASFDISDIAPESVAGAVETCRQFQEDNSGDLRASELSDKRAGFLFWLNRNGHGSGFWDEYYGEDEAIRSACLRLSDACKPWGTSDAYVGDDAKVYLT